MNPRVVIRLRSDARRVLCDTDLRAKPVIPRRYEDAAAMVGSGLLLLALLLGLYFGFHMIGVLLDAP